MDRWSIVLWIFILGAVITAFVLAYQSVSGGLLSQSSPPDYAPTLGPTSAYTKPNYSKLESVYEDTAIASLDQIEVRPTPTGTPSLYTNAQDWIVGVAEHEVKHGGNQIFNLEANQNLYIGGGPLPQGNNGIVVEMTDVDGATILIEGGDIVWRERPPKGTGFVVIVERPITAIIESHNWNSGWFRTEGTDRGLQNAQVNSATGQPNLFPKPPWGIPLRAGDILDVTTPIESQPEAVLRNPREVVLGSEGLLNIRANRWVGQASGQLVRSVEEMRGAKVLIENKISSGQPSQIWLDRSQTATVFPKGWYLDFYTSQPTNAAQGRAPYGNPGQVLLLASDQTISADTYLADHVKGPYPQGKWYRLHAVEDDRFTLSELNSYPLPTPTPYSPPAKSWKANQLTTDSWVGSGERNNTCGGSVKHWTGGADRGTSNELGVFEVSRPDWQFLKVAVYDAAVNQRELPSRRATIMVANPGSYHESVQIGTAGAGTPTPTPVPVEIDKYPVYRNWGIEIFRLEDTKIWMYIYDDQGGRYGGVNQSLGAFSANNVSSELRCFFLVQEYR